MSQRPSWSNKARTTRTGPQVEASLTWGGAGSPDSLSDSPARRRGGLGGISARRSLRPRSATKGCRAFPSSRKASAVRTYAWTVPLEERTLMVLGYMTGRARPVGGCSAPHGSYYHDKSRRIQGRYHGNYGLYPF